MSKRPQTEEKNKEREKEKLNFQNIVCKDHKGQKCTWFCKECMKALCATCATMKLHKTHELIQINEGYEILKKDLLRKRNEFNEDFKQFQERQQKIDDTLASQTSDFEKVKESILNQKTALIQAINKYTEKLLLDLSNKLKESQENLKETKKSLAAIRKKFDQKAKEFEMLSTTKDMAKFFAEGDKKEDKEKNPGNQIGICRPQFIKGHFNNPCFGELKLPVILEKMIKLKVMKDSLITGNAVLNISQCSEKELWIGVQTPEKIISVQKVGFHENDLKVISTLDKYQVTCMTSNSSNEVYFSYPKSNTLSLFADGKEPLGTSIDIAPNVPSAVHITKDQLIIIGAGQPDREEYSLKEPGSLYVLTMNGNQKAVFKNDSKNKPLFSYPWLITSTNNGNIFVIDRFYANEECQVVVLNKDGQTVNKFHTGTKSGPKMFLTGMTRTPFDDILISEPKSHKLYLLDKEGNLITTYNTKSSGVLYPYSLAFLSKTKLYIGSNMSLKSNSDTTKLYEVSYTEF